MTQKYDCKTLLRAQKDVRVCLEDTCNWAIWFPRILMILLGDRSVGKESTCNSGDPHFYFLVGKICWRRDRPPTPVFLGFPCGSAGKESAYNAGDFGSIPGLGRSLREGKGYRLQYSGLQNSGLAIQSMALQTVGHNWASFTFIFSEPNFSTYIFLNEWAEKSETSQNNAWQTFSNKREVTLFHTVQNVKGGCEYLVTTDIPVTAITRWSTPKSDWLYSLQPEMEKLYTVSKNKTGRRLWLRSWTPYCQIQT